MVISNSVRGFTGKYRFLSNFYLASFLMDGWEWPSVEHYYQAHKSADSSEIIRIGGLTTCIGAKRAGRRTKLRKDWIKIKDDVMFAALIGKFSLHYELRKKLLATGNMKLVETNDWGDTYWGEDTAYGGKNKLGKMLMRIRRIYQLND